MIKIGVDMLQISRVEQAIDRHKFMENVFTEEEMKYVEGKLENREIRGYKFFECLAGFFCAKEAVLKALGVGIIYKNVLKDVEVCHRENNEPYARISGKLLSLFSTLSRPQEISISITHDGGFAIANCVLDI